jgi:Fe-Mn family superoxide dismutase
MFKLPELPYDDHALEPVISAETMGFHHGHHHKKYVDTLNKLLADTGETAADLETVVRRASRDPDAAKLFHNAAQAWNHTFFWTCMAPGRARPEGDLAAAIARAFGGHDALRASFVDQGAAHFGSGWVWLAAQGETLKVLTTHDGDNLLTQDGLTPLIACDLWEHAYYLDYQHDREAYLEAWFDGLPNWSFAASQLAAARDGKPLWKHPAPTVKPGTARPEPRSPRDTHA